MEAIAQLTNWIKNLDHQVGDTKAEIELRRKENHEAVIIREDAAALVAYINTHDIPLPVLRALRRCLAWNPFTR